MKMVRLKAIMIAIILLVGLGECARDLTKCVVCQNSNIVSCPDLTWTTARVYVLLVGLH